MSRNHEEPIRCASCNAQQDFTVWESINVTVDPHLKQSLLNGDLTTFRCKRCGNEAHVAYNCLYHDMDNSLAIWLKDEDDEENKAAKQMFLAATHLKTTRTVRTLHELFDKIRVFDDGFDDFEIELFKFSTCLRQQLDLGVPFHYSETRTSFFGRKSLVFVVARANEFETISCFLKDYESKIRQLAKKVRPLIDDSALEWAHLDRSFILRVMEDVGLMKPVTSSGTARQTIQVHTIGRTPEFDDPHDFDEWMCSGGDTYTKETWQIGKEVSADQAAQYRDAKTGDLYVYYQIVDGEWKGRFVSRELFSQMKAVHDA
jgi:hypothetical protein